MAKAVKQAPPRARRSKEAVQEEFENVRREAQEARESASPKAAEHARMEEAEVRQSVEGLTVESVVERISSLGIEVSKSLSGISENLLRETERLASVRAAVELERKELERLHHIDVAATSLDQLVQEYEREKERLESEIASRRSEWEEEARNTDRERKEQEEAARKQRQRETDEYEYKKLQERKRAQDKYDEDIKLLEKKNRERQEELDRSWKQREAEFAAREEEWAQLRKSAETFPARLQSESSSAAAQATQAAESAFEQQIALLRKDAESDKRLAELQIRTLELTLSQQTTQVADLTRQLDEAKRQVQEIAVRAIEGASGATALSHVNKIAMEQAKQRTPQG